MNIKSISQVGARDTNELKRIGKYFNGCFMYDKNYQIEVSKNYFEIYNNEGEHIISFSTNDVLKILKNKKII